MISIRPTIADDLELLITLDHVAQSKTERRELIAASITRGTGYVAISTSEILGYGVLNYSFYQQGLIEMLYVAKGHRRKGVGRALLEQMERECRTTKLFTSTNLSNLPMQTLLKKQGFVVSGVIDNLDEGDPEIVFFKQLNL